MLESWEIGLLTAFLAGMISFLSPCVLPLVPGYLSYAAGQSLETMQAEQRTRARLEVLGLSALFVLGFSLVFVALGASATVVGRLLQAYKSELNIAAGILVILFGLLMTGLARPALLQRELRFHGRLPGARPVVALLLGMAFAFAWTPCIGPVLGALLTLSAARGSVGDGVLLLGVYSLGLGVPFLGAALFMERFVERLRRLGRTGRSLYTVAGVILILMGIAMLTGLLTRFSYWLLEAFPILAEIG